MLHWELIAVGDMAAIELNNFDSLEPHFQDDLELSIESVQANGAGQYAVTLRLTRDLTIPEPAEVIFQENEVELFDAEGKPFRKQGQTNTLSEEGAKMVVNFIGESTNSTPQRLVFSYPRSARKRKWNWSSATCLCRWVGLSDGRRLAEPGLASCGQLSARAAAE